MLFNSLEFAVFFVVVWGINYVLNRHGNTTLRNAWLLAVSLVLYGSFGPWLPLLLCAVIAINYTCALFATGPHGKRAVIAAAILCLGLLGFFKYGAAFGSSWLLPVGLSFFTFQALSYTIDVYRGTIKAERNVLKVSLFISFMPTLLSGPIERAGSLMPQLSRPAVIDSTAVGAGIKAFVWGLFKKAVIADRLADYVSAVYSSPMSYNGTTLALAAVCFSIQIYSDFSGYADMAIGFARMLGFRIMENFRFPYFSLSIKEFWRRWHISLTSWFREYVYIPLGGSRVSPMRWVLNIAAVFLLSGIWHGVTAGFIIWAAIHAAVYLLEHYLRLDRGGVAYGAVCFAVVTIAWIFFRVPDCGTAAAIVGRIFSDAPAVPFMLLNRSFASFAITGVLLLLFMAREWLSWQHDRPMQQMTDVECVLLLCVIALFCFSGDKFIYMQF